MNKKVIDYLKRYVGQIDAIGDALQGPLDNTDDFGLSVEDEAQIRNLIGMVRATQDELKKLVES